MPKHLYFICPTDHLETVINRHYNEENYFISSLGNSIDFNKQFTAYLCDLVEAKGITEISFVLAQDNTLFNDPRKNKLSENIKVKTITYGKKMFKFKGPKILNNIKDLTFYREAKTKQYFRRKYKAYLIKLEQ